MTTRLALPQFDVKMDELMKAMKAAGELLAERNKLRVAAARVVAAYHCQDLTTTEGKNRLAAVMDELAEVMAGKTSI